MSGKRPVQPQPPKLPKQQTPSSTNQAKNPPGQLVPLSPSLIANRYIVFTIPKPTKTSEKRLVQPQPPKLPKQQTPSSTSQAKNPPGQLVPFSPSLIANRYIVFTIPKPNYQRPPHSQPSYSSTLAAPPPKAITLVEGPFGPTVPQKLSSPYPSRKGRSSYVKKPFVQNISYIEPQLPNLVHIQPLIAIILSTE
ncbi:vegetative cell wall protein gp1 [Quercus suber]|uniref:vegetative cell wall protein gp1 n=1 Tax=Quercus suber TaxID=58331 RepID=UPI000CE1ED94|nr:vegetative cell wall protein gp1-like [Quercus suber]POF00330.1 hypothetical protein CFP56_33963 [Quercus suber]